MENSVNQRYKTLRSHLGLSQTELAEQLKITQAAISAFEKGRSGISPDILKKTSDTFNVNMNWLLNGQGEMFLETKGNKQIEWKDEAFSALREEVKYLREMLNKSQDALFNYINKGDHPNFHMASDVLRVV